MQLTLGYNNNFSIDGTGAQLQRIIGIACLAEFLGVKYVNNGIKNITIHPLDPFQKETEKNYYLENINSVFVPANAVTAVNNENTLIVSKLSISKLLILIVISKMKKTELQIDLAEPYQIIDAYPKIYELAPALFSNFDKFRFEGKPNFIHIVIHYRWGVGGGAVYHEQKISRELPVNYYLEILEKITKSFQENVEYGITILTDAPLVPISYKPNLNQNFLWEGTPGFTENQLNIEGADFSQFTVKYPGRVEILSGGDPFDAMKIMVNADILLLSRSSLSYVSGLLNKKAQIFYPPNFWHPKLSGWK